MTQTKTIWAAVQAEKKARAIGRKIQAAARKRPENEMLRVVSETVPIIINLAEKVAKLIPASEANLITADILYDGDNLFEQAIAGLVSRADALAEVDRMEASSTEYLDQIRLKAWQDGCKNLAELGYRSGTMSAADVRKVLQ